MQRLSSSLFMLALLVYYLPKIFKMKKSKYVKVHIGIGAVSIIAMCLAFIQKFGSSDFIKYLGFASIMVAIGVSGYYSTSKNRLGRKLHIASTIGFFVYLFAAVKLL
ncbi:hypothetical protein R0131_04185 [Clostridium sp. AL.422]|uniref:hypothetical protein n=1 Tax=Clostridium TaxID=1485 RepID=UPI00293DD41B|nr:MULTISPECIES: hypothetical protein [unclassified Clostridium]MDV4150029.1 hypothetical protein [Clostridium sp. AL.422]